MSDSYYMSCAETAKLVRAGLKKAFPGQKFSVRSHTYSGGASIDVRWTDGPQEADVKAVAGRYNGAGFDGMIDLKTYNADWLYPDGTVEAFQSEIGHSYGSTTYGPGGERVTDEDTNDYIRGVRIGAGVTNTIPPSSPDSLAYRRGLRDGKARVEAGARLVHFGADYIFTRRDLSPETEQRLKAAVAFLGGEPGEEFNGDKRYDVPRPRLPGGGDNYGWTLVHRMSQVPEDEIADAMKEEAERRAAAEAKSFNEQAGDEPTGFYVTVQDCGQWGALLGPYATKEEAEANVQAGKELAKMVNDRAGWYAYGVTKVTMKPGAVLPAGKLNALHIEREAS